MKIAPKLARDFMAFMAWRFSKTEAASHGTRLAFRLSTMRWLGLTLLMIGCGEPDIPKPFTGESEVQTGGESPGARAGTPAGDTEPTPSTGSSRGETSDAQTRGNGTTPPASGDPGEVDLCKCIGPQLPYPECPNERPAGCS